MRNHLYSLYPRKDVVLPLASPHSSCWQYPTSQCGWEPFTRSDELFSSTCLGATDYIFPRKLFYILSMLYITFWNIFSWYRVMNYKIDEIFLSWSTDIEFLKFHIKSNKISRSSCCWNAFFFHWQSYLIIDLEIWFSFDLEYSESE